MPVFKLNTLVSLIQKPELCKSPYHQGFGLICGPGEGGARAQLTPMLCAENVPRPWDLFVSWLLPVLSGHPVL